jgi:hypothetical protein
VTRLINWQDIVLPYSFNRGNWHSCPTAQPYNILRRHPGESRDHQSLAVIPAKAGIQSLAVIPAKAGIQLKNIFYWMPVFTGMTDEWMPFAGTTALPYRSSR